MKSEKLKKIIENCPVKFGTCMNSIIVAIVNFIIVYFCYCCYCLFYYCCYVVTVVAFKEHVDKMKSELSDASSNCGLLTHAMETVRHRIWLRA